jgi:CheY-like chemotaxis protein
VPTAPAQPMIAVIDRDRLTAYGLALLLRDWGYQSVTGVSAEEIFGRTEAQGQPIAADDRSEDGSTGEDEATALSALAHRSIPIIVLATGGEGGGEAGGINRIPKPIEPFRLRDLLRTVVTFSP